MTSGKSRTWYHGIQECHLQPSEQCTLCKMACSMEQLQVLVPGHIDTTFFQLDGVHPHTVNFILDVLHDVFGGCVL